MPRLPSPSALCLLLMMLPLYNGRIGEFKLGEIGLKGSMHLTMSYACRDRFSNEIFILRHGYYKISWGGGGCHLPLGLMRVGVKRLIQRAHTSCLGGTQTLCTPRETCVGSQVRPGTCCHQSGPSILQINSQPVCIAFHHAHWCSDPPAMGGGSYGCV